MIPVFACVLKSGGDYLPEHVQSLAKQVRSHTTIPHEFVCYSDVDVPGVIVRKLIGNYKGWWAVPEVFRQRGATIITGIDTVIYDNIDELFHIATTSSEKDFWMINAFADPNKTASGIMIYNGDWSWLWEEYQKQDNTVRFRGEQDFTNYQLKKNGIIPKRVQDWFDGVCSWKHHCKKGIPKGSKVILFHGKPRPHEVPSLWKEINQ